MQYTTENKILFSIRKRSEARVSSDRRKTKIETKNDLLTDLDGKVKRGKLTE